MLEISREIDGGHAAATDFPLDGVAVGKGSFQSFERVCHRLIRCDLRYDRARSAEFGALLGPYARKAAKMPTRRPHSAKVLEVEAVAPKAGGP